MTIHSLTTLDDLGSVRDYWQASQCHANHDLAQFELVCRLRPEVLSPFVTVIDHEHQPAVLLAGRLEQTTVAPAIGYFKPVAVPARVLVVIHEGVIGPLDDQTAELTIDYLTSLLANGVADALNFHHLGEQSPLLKALQHRRSTSLCSVSPRWITHRAMCLDKAGKTLDQAMSARHRSSMRKRLRELDAAYRGRITWRWLSSFDDMAGLCRQLEAVAATTYQRGLGVGFFDNEEYRRRFELFASRGQLRVCLLDIDGQTRAFWFGTVYDGVFNATETAYDPAYRDYQIGMLLFARMVGELAREGVRRLDFGIGDAHYKQRFADQSWRETSVWMYAPTLKGQLMKMLQGSCDLIDAAVRSILNRAGQTSRLKTFLRLRVVRSARTES